MRKKFTVLDLIFSIGRGSDDIPVTVKTSREEVGTAPSLRWMENPRHCGPGILEARVKELTMHPTAHRGGGVLLVLSLRHLHGAQGEGGPPPG